MKEKKTQPTADKASHRWMAVKCYITPRPQGHTMGEVILLGKEKTFHWLLAENKHTDVAEIKDRITPQLITRDAVIMTKSCYDWCGQAAHKHSPPARALEDAGVEEYWPFSQASFGNYMMDIKARCLLQLRVTSITMGTV